MNKLNYEQKIEHLKYAYSHTQATARFMDRKASAVIAGVTTLASLDFAVYKWLISFIKPPNNTDAICLYWILWILALLATIYLFTFIALSLQNAFNVLSPKGPDESFSSAIFPYIPYKGKGVELMEGERSKATSDSERVRLYESDLDEQEAIKDFTNQLIRMGEINYGKITAGKAAITYLIHIIGASFALAGLVTIFSLVLKTS